MEIIEDLTILKPMFEHSGTAIQQALRNVKVISCKISRMLPAIKLGLMHAFSKMSLPLNEQEHMAVSFVSAL